MSGPPRTGVCCMATSSPSLATQSGSQSGLPLRSCIGRLIQGHRGIPRFRGFLGRFLQSFTRWLPPSRTDIPVASAKNLIYTTRRDSLDDIDLVETTTRHRADRLDNSGSNWSNLWTGRAYGSYLAGFKRVRRLAQETDIGTTPQSSME